MCVARMTINNQKRICQKSRSCPRNHTDVGDGGSNADFNARITLLSQLALKEFIQFGVEHAIGDEFSTLGNRGPLCCGGHDCGCLKSFVSTIGV